jgi:hypothetical protein
MSDRATVSVVPEAGTPAAQSAAAPPGNAARDFMQRVEKALDALMTLKIVTVVGPVAVAGAGTDISVAIAPGAATEAACTEINLLNGDIANVFSSGFAALSNGDMRGFHQSQVEKSQSIVTGNLAEVQKLAMALSPQSRR